MFLTPTALQAPQRTGSAAPRGASRAAAPDDTLPPATTAAQATPAGVPLDPFEAAAAAAPTPEEAALAQREAAFDYRLRVRAELEREHNALRDLAVNQMKQDDELLKKFIAMI